MLLGTEDVGDVSVRQSVKSCTCGVHICCYDNCVGGSVRSILGLARDNSSICSDILWYIFVLFCGYFRLLSYKQILERSTYVCSI